MTARTIFRALTTFVGVIFTAWIVGLIMFVATVGGYNEPRIDDAMPPTEAIVVLTGGSERMTAGIELLSAGKGQKLLISGVYQKLTPDKLLANQRLSQDLRACCVVLGHSAADTIGNAEETRAWMNAEHYTSLRLVTAHYHMPRSLLLFHRLMPDIKIIPYPVTPESVKLTDWWLRSGTASLLVTEYDKYLFAASSILIGDFSK